MPLYLDEPMQNKLNIRKLDEQPWQQIKCGNFDELEKTLVDVEIFLAFSNKDRFEIWRYWQLLPPAQKDIVKKYSDALSVWKSVLIDPKKYELALNELAHYYYVNGEELESSKLIEEALKISKTLYPQNDIRIAIRKNNYAATLCHIKDYRKAESLFRKALPIYVNHYGNDHEKTWGVREGIAICHFCTDRISIGIKEEEECLEWFSKNYGDDDLKTLVSIQNTADALRRGNFNKEAKGFYEKAHKGFLKIFGKNHPYTISCSQGLKLAKFNLKHK